MRQTSISSSIASALSRVFACEFAGSAGRMFLHLTHLRGYLLMDLGYWLESCQPRFAFADARRLTARNPMPGKQPGMFRHLGNMAPAVCPAPSSAFAARLATVRSRG